MQKAWPAHHIRTRQMSCSWDSTSLCHLVLPWRGTEPHADERKGYCNSFCSKERKFKRMCNFCKLVGHFTGALLGNLSQVRLTGWWKVNCNTFIEASLQDVSICLSRHQQLPHLGKTTSFLQNSQHTFQCFLLSLDFRLSVHKHYPFLTPSDNRICR